MDDDQGRRRGWRLASVRMPCQLGRRRGTPRPYGWRGAGLAAISAVPRRLSVVLLLMIAVGCEHAPPLAADGGNEATLTNIQQTIFTTSCAVSGCHAGPRPQQLMDLSAGQAFANLVGVPSRERPTLDRVVPGVPDASYLVWKIEGRPEITGARMPLGRPPLSAAQIALIRQWIAEGALDN